MAKKIKTAQQASDQSVDLKSRLEETEETLRAIRQYTVDAFVVTRSNGVEVVTLSNSDFPYRMMVESMDEVALTLIPDGTIFYCNPRFAEMVHRRAEKQVDIRFQDLIMHVEHIPYNTLLTQHGHQGSRGAL